jgi:hypothetical protein
MTITIYSNINTVTSLGNVMEMDMKNEIEFKVRIMINGRIR